MSNVQLFDFKSHQIRVVEINGNPWFVSLGVSEALGFSYANLRYHMKSTLDESERVIAKLSGFRGNGATVISESGLYKLVMRSDKPSYC